MQIGLKELRETAVWLDFMYELGARDESIEPLRREGNELTATFVAALKTAKRPNPEREAQDDS